MSDEFVPSEAQKIGAIFVCWLLQELRRDGLVEGGCKRRLTQKALKEYGSQIDAVASSINQEQLATLLKMTKKITLIPTDEACVGTASIAFQSGIVGDAPR